MTIKEKKTKLKKSDKVTKIGKKKLGMGLSSLLSKDAELSSVIKAKISEQVSNTDNFNVKRPTLGVAKVSKLNPSGVIGSDNIQRTLPIQNLVSGKFNLEKISIWLNLMN